MTVSELVYERTFFNPAVRVEIARDDALKGGDKPLESPYLYDDQIVLAVNVAMAAQRPLLVSGPAGSGKSALAASIARQLRWKYDEKVITARMDARDLKWRFDAIARLQAAQETGGKADLNPARFITKEVLWRAFEASRRGERTVVLLDEIDKADPDLPNSLLETLGRGKFPVDGLHADIEIGEHPPFIVITTNNERELSRPFVRRCVTLTLPPPDGPRLIRVARAWNLAAGDDEAVATTLATEVEKLTKRAVPRAEPHPSIAEYLDALRACLILGIRPGTSAWEAVSAFALTKRIELVTERSDAGRPG
jgi:MoxR-like ATPase